MSELDDLFREESAESPSPSDLSFDKEAWGRKKQELRETVYTLIDDTTREVAQDSGQFQHYLDVQSQFDRYSVSNALLILAQRPDATRIADFDAWKEQGAYIRSKQTCFYILEPGEEYRREDGTTGTSYNPKKMFDIMQTNLSHKREHPVFQDDRTRIKALMDRAPVPIRISDELPEGTHALYQPDRREVLIRRGLGAEDIFRSLAQEMAHAELDPGNGSYQRADFDFHAYCASYMLCRQYGVPTESYRFDRVPAKLENMEPQQIRAELSVMKEAANDMARRMNRILAQQRQPKRSEAER